MSWINEFTNEVKSLDLTVKNLRKFGLYVGGVFILIWLFIFYNNYNNLLAWITGIIGTVLFLFGIFLPKSLKVPYKVWMSVAFLLGNIVSRIILLIVFYLIISPLGLAAKIFNRKFLDINYIAKKKSYWVIKENKNFENNSYEKMY